MSENEEEFEDFIDDNESISEQTFENERIINELVLSLYVDDNFEQLKYLPIKDTISILNKISSILETEERKFREEIPIGDIDDSNFIYKFKDMELVNYYQVLMEKKNF